MANTSKKKEHTAPATQESTTSASSGITYITKDYITTSPTTYEGTCIADISDIWETIESITKKKTDIMNIGSYGCIVETNDGNGGVASVFVPNVNYVDGKFNRSI